MNQRGRKSASELAIVPVFGLERLPPPPANMPVDQGHIWEIVVKTPAFSLIGEEAYPLLTEYCRAVSSANQVAEEIDKFDRSWLIEEDGLKRWEKLLKLQAMMMGKVADLALKLRIAPSSRNDRDKVASKKTSRKPWEVAQEATETSPGLKSIA